MYVVSSSTADEEEAGSSSTADEEDLVSGLLDEEDLVSGLLDEEDDLDLNMKSNFPSAYSTISVITIDTIKNTIIYPMYPPPDDG